MKQTKVLNLFTICFAFCKQLYILGKYFQFYSTTIQTLNRVRTKVVENQEYCSFIIVRNQALKTYETQIL